MSINKRNHEGYYDPTVYEALKNIEKESKNQKFIRQNQKNNQNNQCKNHYSSYIQRFHETEIKKN